MGQWQLGSWIGRKVLLEMLVSLPDPETPQCLAGPGPPEQQHGGSTRVPLGGCGACAGSAAPLNPALPRENLGEPPGSRVLRCDCWCLIFLKQTRGEAEGTSWCLSDMHQGKELEQSPSKVRVSCQLRPKVAAARVCCQPVEMYVRAGVVLPQHRFDRHYHTSCQDYFPNNLSHPLKTASMVAFFFNNLVLENEVRISGLVACRTEYFYDIQLPSQQQSVHSLRLLLCFIK